MARLGYWPEGPAKTHFPRWVSLLGVQPDIFRGRGGEGSFNPDDKWLADESLEFFQNGGYRLSLQIAPKTGSGGNRRGVPAQEIIDGKWDQFMLGRFREFAVLPKKPRHPFEPASEANVQKDSPTAQPKWCRPDQYPAVCRKWHDLAVQAGVRDRLRFTLSMTKGPWDSNEWETWTKGLDDVLDVYAVDGYSMPKTAQAKSFASITKGVREAARSKGLKWAVMETGAQEMPGNPEYKALWFDEAGEFLASDEGKDCAYVVINLSDDGPGGWPPTTSPKALAAVKRFVGNRGAFPTARTI